MGDQDVTGVDLGFMEQEFESWEVRQSYEKKEKVVLFRLKVVTFPPK